MLYPSFAKEHNPALRQLCALSILDFYLGLNADISTKVA
jgi:hypothetical protein